MGIGSLDVKQICICVWDLERAERNWNRVLGVQGERLKTPKWRDVPSYTYNRADTFDGVDFLLYRLDNGVNLEVFGPGEGENPWRSFLEKHGEGVMNIAFYVADREAAYAAIASEENPKGPYHEGYYPDCTYTFVDTFDTLGTELNIKDSVDNTAKIAGFNRNPADYHREI